MRPAFDGDCSTDEVSWFSIGADSQVRAGVRGCVFELVQFNRKRPLEEGLVHLIRFTPLIYRSGGILNWLHGERFVRQWKRHRFIGFPPENFETEAEAVGALKAVLRARRAFAPVFDKG